MSGGIDSSVAAMVLKNDGYDIVGATYRVFDCEASDSDDANPFDEARRLAAQLGIEHHLIDLRKDFADTVVSDFISQYLNARTPNPCVVCNSTIKWGKMMDWADALGCDFIATGHYARVASTDDGRFYLKRGADLSKDQTYFLWRLSQDNLRRTLFPLGDLTKSQVRQIANDLGFEQLSNKSESQEICFIPDNDYRAFLRRYVPNYSEIVKKGDFIDVAGKKIGEHSGFPNYTIGQRKGLGVAFGAPRFVTHIDAVNNKVTLGERADLFSDKCVIKDVNMMKIDDFTDGLTVMAKLRYRSRPVAADIYHHQLGAELRFHSPAESVTPGQSAVLYTGPDFEDVLGGGFIV